MASSIAAVTEVLWSLIDRELGRRIPGVKVTTRVPDKARHDASDRQLNMFLYQVTEDANQRNVAIGEGRLSPLACSLHYILSCYGPDDVDIDYTSHTLLSEAIGVLQAYPVLELALPPAADTTSGSLPWRIHIAMQPLSLDELCKLWTMFQTPYRLSVTFEVRSVVIGPQK